MDQVLFLHQAITDHWGEITLSFTWGVLSSLSPCVGVLIPLLLYHFTRLPTSTRPYSIFLFLLGFEGAYIIGGLFLQLLIGTIGQSGLKLGLGSAFSILGTLSLFGRIDGPTIPALDRPLLAGALFACAVASNPCALPYLAAIFSLGPAAAVRSATAFGAGVLLPALLAALIGREFLRSMRKGPWLFYASQFSAALLPLAGGWMLLAGVRMAGKELFSVGDALVATNLLVGFVGLVAKKIDDTVPVEEKEKSVVLSVLLKIAYGRIKLLMLALSLSVFLVGSWLLHWHPYFPSGGDEMGQETCPDPGLEGDLVKFCGMCGAFVLVFGAMTGLICFGLIVVEVSSSFWRAPRWFSNVKHTLEEMFSFVAKQFGFGLKDSLSLDAFV